MSGVPKNHAFSRWKIPKDSGTLSRKCQNSEVGSGFKYFYFHPGPTWGNDEI